MGFRGQECPRYGDEIMSEWKEVKLSDISQLQYGYTATSKKINVGPKYLRITDIVKDTIDWDNVPFCKIEEKKISKYLLNIGDIVVARTGNTVGYAKLIRKDTFAVFASYLIRIQLNQTKADPNYVGRLIESNIFKKYIHSMKSGAAQPNANAEVIGRFQFCLPPLKTQQKIASILSTYDDLIENNNRRIAILEEMAQKLYREWFVKFRFPGYEEVKMVESELGLIPEGWEVVKLSEVAKVNPESITARTAPESIKYIDISSVGTGSIDNVKEILFSESPSRARRKVAHQDIIWATVRPNRKQYAYIVNPEEDTIVSTGFAVIRAEKIPSSYLYFAVTTENYVNYLVNNASGSAYPAVNVNEFKNSDILQPPDMLLQQYAEVVDTFLSTIENLSKRNANLKDQRDLLLPKLISGKIEVS